jgi:hypothetical protein
MPAGATALNGWSGRLAALQRLPGDRVHWIGPVSASACAATAPLIETETGCGPACGDTTKDARTAQALLCVEQNREATFAYISIFDVDGVSEAVQEGRAEMLASAVRVALRAAVEDSVVRVLFVASPHQLDPFLVAVMGRQPTKLNGPFRCWVRNGSGSIHSSDLAGVPAVPEGYELGALTAPDAELVDDRWPYRDATTLDMVRECIVERPSAAVRWNGTLVAWATTRSDGSVGMLHTEAEHRKRGLASIIVSSLVAQLHLQGQSPYVDRTVPPCSRLGVSHATLCDGTAVLRPRRAPVITSSSLQVPLRESNKCRLRGNCIEIRVYTNSRSRIRVV